MSQIVGLVKVANIYIDTYLPRFMM